MFDLSSLIIFVPVLLVAMAFHEMTHAFVSHWLGDPTAKDLGRLTLNPFAHIDPILSVMLPAVLIALGLPPILAAKPVPFNPDRVKFEEFGAALIAVAGPISNLLLAAVGALVLRFFDLSSGIFDIVGLFVAINVALFVFNMIPIPPLDGSRLLFAFAPEPLQKVMMQIEALGFTVIIIFFVLIIPVIAPVLISVNEGILRFLLGPLIQL